MCIRDRLLSYYVKEHEITTVNCRVNKYTSPVSKYVIAIGLYLISKPLLRKKSNAYDERNKLITVYLRRI